MASPLVGMSAEDIEKARSLIGLVFTHQKSPAFAGLHMAPGHGFAVMLPVLLCQAATAFSLVAVPASSYLGCGPVHDTHRIKRSVPWINTVRHYLGPDYLFGSTLLLGRQERQETATLPLAEGSLRQDEPF